VESVSEKKPRSTKRAFTDHFRQEEKVRLEEKAPIEQRSVSKKTGGSYKPKL
jgi:hypothetical protein